MKKLFVGILMVCLVVGFVGVVSAANIDVKMSNWNINSGGYIDATFIISNNTKKYLNYCEVSIILLNNGNIIGSYSRPVTEVPPGGFISKRYWFKGVTTFTHYKWSATKVYFK